jgi:hypothetical protein
MRKHIETVLAAGDKDHADYILNWMAYAVQNLAKRTEVVLVFLGEQGCGKGVVAEAFGRAFGQHYAHLSQESHLTGNFNSHLALCKFVFLDEAIWANDKRVIGLIKALITEPNMWMEEKFQPKLSIPNRMNFMVASNADWVVPVEIGDRRYAVFQCNNRYANKNGRAAAKAYFDPLWHELDNGGTEAML